MLLKTSFVYVKWWLIGNHFCLQFPRGQYYSVSKHPHFLHLHWNSHDFHLPLAYHHVWRFLGLVRSLRIQKSPRLLHLVESQSQKPLSSQVLVLPEFLRGWDQPLGPYQPDWQCWTRRNGLFPGQSGLCDEPEHIQVLHFGPLRFLLCGCRLGLPKYPRRFG